MKRSKRSGSFRAFLSKSYKRKLSASGRRGGGRTSRRARNYRYSPFDR